MITSRVVPILMIHAREKQMMLKIASEKALVYILQLNQPTTEVLDLYLNTQEPLAKKTLGEYVKRVLVRIKDE